MSNMSAFHYELSLAESQHDLRSNLLPLGLVKKGAYRHRALLFKVGEERERSEGGEEGRGGEREALCNRLRPGLPCASIAVPTHTAPAGLV